VHLDRGYDSGVSRALLAELGVSGEIAWRGVPASLQGEKRWFDERTQAWINGYGTLRRCIEQVRRGVDVFLFLAAAFVVARMLIQRARSRFRWPGRPTRRSHSADCRSLLREVDDDLGGGCRSPAGRYTTSAPFWTM
jgi:hypothetical protein